MCIVYSPGALLQSVCAQLRMQGYNSGTGSSYKPCGAHLCCWVWVGADTRCGLQLLYCCHGCHAALLLWAVTVQGGLRASCAYWTLGHTCRYHPYFEMFVAVSCTACWASIVLCFAIAVALRLEISAAWFTPV